MHALMHIGILYVNAWDAISAHDFACIDWARASRAFAFCIQYKRGVEFRRLCEILRNHIQSQTKCATLT